MNQTAKQARTILVPQYIQQFSCIGSDCEDSCCVGWRVDIDKDTYKKYQNVQDKELKPILDKKVTRKRSNPTVATYAKIKMENNSRCPFLTEDSLCQVQTKLGAEYLSNTCAIYPRTLNQINGIIEKSLTMSCPEAARLALLNPNGIEFEEVEESVETRSFINRQLETNEIKLKNKLEKYFWELRIFTIQVLQDRSYTLDDRLIILGLFYQKIQETVEQNNVHSIPNIIARYINIMENSDMKSIIGDIPSQSAIQMKLCKELVDVRYSQGINSQRYLECLVEALAGIEYTREATEEEISKRYKVAYDKYYSPFMKEHEYILENYLVNYVFKNLFPLNQKTVFDDYIMLVIHYALIKLHLIGMSGHHKGMTINIVIKLIQSFAKTVEHNNVYLKNIFDLLKKNDCTSMAYMAILIKN